MYQPLCLEDGERIEELCGEDLDELGREPSEGVLLDKLVEVRGEAFENEAEVGVMHELGPHTKDVVLVVWVGDVVELSEQSTIEQRRSRQLAAVSFRDVARKEGRERANVHPQERRLPSCSG
jgi:hypothetical protein